MQRWLLANTAWRPKTAGARRRKFWAKLLTLGNWWNQITKKPRGGIAELSNRVTHAAQLGSGRCLFRARVAVGISRRRSNCGAGLPIAGMPTRNSILRECIWQV